MHLRCGLVVALLLAALLQGCTLSRAQIKRADSVVAASVDQRRTCDREDLCAMPSPLLDAADQALAHSTPDRPEHVVTLLDDSEAAMVARINLIRAARQSIDVQTYIWDEDDTGELILNELIGAARRGVKVRILADQLFSFEDPDLLERLTRVSPNLHVRLYNPTFNNSRTPPLEFAAGIVCCFMKFNQRMHNKLLLVDGRIGITGGRNYQDRYFNWDNDFDYLDRDVMVGGPAAQQMAASFNLFWKLKRSVPLTHLRDVNRLILRDPTPPPWPTPHYTYPARVEDAVNEAQDPDWLTQHLIDPSLITGKVEYFSDRPAKTEQPDKRDALQFTAHLMHLIGGAQHEVILQTPYLVMSRRAQKIFKRLHRQAPPPQIVVSTNSLASTDAFAVYAVSYKHRKSYLNQFGFNIYELKPHAPVAADAYVQANVIDETEDSDTSLVPKLLTLGRRRYPGTDRRPGLFGSIGKRNRPAPLLSAGRRFGLHAKSLVVDDSFAMVGSHNFDPRSDHYNTEAGVIVYDQRFASELRTSILQATEAQNAWIIAPRKPTIPVLGQVSQVIGDISAKLPFFDLWPFRYATSYELKPDCPPMQPGNPDFSRCYEAVGDFPDVAISPKLLYTRLITAFGAGVKGIL
ncbi:phospholipase D-like domain-containing protein [Dyella mobilis]|uniref:Phospholipase D family protein n=1 Tax=Dyella mobilis TaxID=1849582 RepID=A0ABS2KGE1_9GAMM|nr:phospholipase D family protein [Dyella mobilis]MBM7129988.1 phospholipase D family protein [Dyella mobilis]GLQ97747.1 phospholipase D family protein [Dyella mobilis]